MLVCPRGLVLACVWPQGSRFCTCVNDSCPTGLLLKGRNAYLLVIICMVALHSTHACLPTFTKTHELQSPVFRHGPASVCSPTPAARSPGLLLAPFAATCASRSCSCVLVSACSQDKRRMQQQLLQRTQEWSRPAPNRQEARWVCCVCRQLGAGPAAAAAFAAAPAAAAFAAAQCRPAKASTAPHTHLNEGSMC